MKRKAALTCLPIVLILLSLVIGADPQACVTITTSLDPFYNPEPNSIHSSQNALWNDQVYFEWSNGSIVCWKVDDNGNKDPTDDEDLIRGGPVGNSIDLGWTDPEHTLDHTFYTTGTDTNRGYHSASANIVSEVETNETVGSVLICGDLGPNARFQIRYTIFSGYPAIYAQVAIAWTQPTIIGFVGYGAYTSYPSFRDVPEFFLLGNETEFPIDALPFVSGWYVGFDQEARFAALRNSYTGRIIGMTARVDRAPGQGFEVSGDSKSPWGRGLTYFFKYRGSFSRLQPSFTAEFMMYSDNSNSYKVFLARTTQFPDTIPPLVSFISPHEGIFVKGIVQIEVKVSSNVIVSRVELSIERVQSGWIDITSSYDSSTGYYYYNWDTTNEPNGSHILLARVTDIAGNQGTSRINLSVFNPKVSIGLLGALVLCSLIVLLLLGYQKRRLGLRRFQEAIQAIEQRELEFERTGRLREFTDLAKYEILIFQDLAERYAVSSTFIQRTIESFVSKGILWGIATDEVFIGVDFAISTLKRLSKVYGRITWQSLMEEFQLQSEKDLKVLLIQVSYSQEVVFQIDEIEKSVRILAVEELKPVEHAPRLIACPSCGTALGPRADHCDSCGEDFPQCIVCHLPILDDFTKTPCCGSPGHSVHLREWLKIKQTCPICKEKLKEEWIL